MTYLPTESDKKDEIRLKQIVRGESQGVEATSALKEIFTNLVLWSKEDVETHLTKVYNFNPLEVDNLLALHPSIVTLPENIFPLDIDNLPDTTQADPFGKIMVYQEDNGWILIDPEEVEDFHNLYKCTHWTYTPDLPPQP